MTFADAADLLAAAGVIAPITMLAFETRQRRKQTEFGNWHAIFESSVAVEGLTKDPELAAFLEWAKADYDALSPSRSATHRIVF